MRFSETNHTQKGATFIPVMGVLLASIIAGGHSVAQQKPASSPKSLKTELEFQLLIEGNVVTGLSAQEWGRTFQKLGVALRIRRPILDDHPEVKERKLGTIRQVTVIGRLDQSGRILFPGRSFTLSDLGRLSEWIRELKTYGAQGSPSGQPEFGLNPRQFRALATALATRLTTEVQGKSLDEALTLLDLPAEYPLHRSVEAERWLTQPAGSRPFRQMLKGISNGTALAVLLNDYGLGYRPLRTPSGTIELTIEPLQADVDHWSVGWELPEHTSRLKVAPKLFKLTPIEVHDTPLPDLIKSVSAAAKVPILVDNFHIEQDGIDWEKVVVSYPQRQSSWSLLLKAATNPNKLSRRLLIDDAGRAFVWITTLQRALQVKKPLR